jgi:hypothetical protein
MIASCTTNVGLCMLVVNMRSAGELERTLIISPVDLLARRRNGRRICPVESAVFDASIGRARRVRFGVQRVVT